MTERTAPDAGAIACPFVAFEDDRDERAERPDHRHRCYAEVRPAPRALAHQEVFCLSAGFAACPSFQDWARRQAASARRAAPDAGLTTTGPAPAPAPADELADLSPGSAARAHGDEPDDGADALNAWTGRSADPGSDLARPVRNPQRGWAAPPPWIDPGSGNRDEPGAPGFLTRPGRPSGDAPASETTGLAGSRWLRDAAPDQAPGPAPGQAPDGDAGGPIPPSRTPDDDDLERSLAEDRAARERSAGASPAGGPTAAAPGTFRSRSGGPSGPPPARPTVSDTRRRPIERDAAGPAWERPRRFEAYPTLKTRVGLPSVPRIALAALALLVAAGFLFALPFIWRLGGTGGGAAASPTPAPTPSVSLAPTEPPAPTAQVYVVKQGDTMLKIAKKFGLSVEELLAANKQIKNADKIAIGDELNIPAPAPSEIINDSGASSASP